MSTDAKPTLLLLHGAFGSPAAFDLLVPYLEQAGYPTFRGTYPSANAKNAAEVTAQKDIEHFRAEYLLPLIEKEKKDVVLVVHSFGGVVAGGAAVGLSKSVRKDGEGGVVGLVYISGNLVNEGQTLIESAGGQWPPWLVKDNPSTHLATISPLFETLAHDAPSSLHPSITSSTVPQGYLCFSTPSTKPCWSEEAYTGRLAYVRTAEDRINPAFAQDLWIEGSGVKWNVVNMETSHAPYISQPKELAEHVVNFVEGFGKV